MQLINNILDFSRIDDQPLSPKMHDFEPDRIMEEVHRFFSDRVAGKNLELTIDLDNIPAMIQGDDEILSRILHNIIDNAVKFTENGSITLTMRVVGVIGENILLRCDDSRQMIISGWTDTDIQKLTDVLDRLESLLADDNTSSGELFDEFKALLEAALGPTADRIGRYIRGFDFADALNSLRNARRELAIPGKTS